jgi:DNA-binding MarR family transcriptional regulator
MAERAATVPQAVGDDELITAWGLLIESVGTTGPLLLRGVDPGGGDMSGPWFEVLIRLQRSPDHRLPMSRLAREVSLSSGGFTKLADRMERAGYLTRQDCPSDRRVVYAALTPEGLEFAERARARHVALLREHVLGPLGPDGLRRLADLARVLRDTSAAAGGVPGGSPGGA